MLRFHVACERGHYGFPGRNGSFSQRATAPVPHVSTVRGFMESICGDELGTFQGRYAYGRVHLPKMMGRIFRKDSVPPRQKKEQASRPCYWNVLFGVAYQVIVEGEYEDRLRLGLKGELSRYGILSLGTSDDVVWLLREYAREAQWVVPGQAFPLVVEPQRGYTNLRPKYGYFDLTPHQLEPPSNAWVGGPQPV